jgi:hypothetical protein
MTYSRLKRCSKAVLVTLLVIAGIPGCVTKEDKYSQQLTEWKIAPAVSAITPALNAIAVNHDAVNQLITLRPTG